ncbi:AbrB/MazE/SpoVT family DNA-binding domain-containing protein [Candidatus Bathyarchaeota archaeon]|nr:AbrB/MazE/SpoVT family DNA-binding domain-containing protein [Candidatus Bathyarchaeota archaeon]
MTERYRSKVGPKGQVVVVKELREKYGIKEGGIVEQISTDKGVLLIPVSVDGLLEELDAVSEEVGRTWPKGVSAVEAVKEDREKRWQKK